MIMKIFKRKKNNIISFVIGMILVLAIGGVVAATTYNSADVMYDLPSGAKVTSNTVKGALDQLFNRVSNNKKYYYAFGNPTASSPIDYGSLGRYVFVRIFEDNIGTTNKEVCIVRNGKLGCFKNGYDNWASNKYLIQAFFSDLTCTTQLSSTPYEVSCGNYSANCYVRSNGNVGCFSSYDGLPCNVYANGNVECG